MIGQSTRKGMFVMLLTLVSLTGETMVNAACCKNGESYYTGCTACPADWYSSCNSPYTYNDWHGGCGFMSLGCKLSCRCRDVCGCYDSSNNIDHAKCRTGGDSGAMCNDGGRTTSSYSCDCSTGFYDNNGVCRDVDGCEGGQQTCRDGGDSGATCQDEDAPSLGFYCSCSSGYYDDAGTCRPKTCNAISLRDGEMSSGTDGCYNGLVMNAINDVECDITCSPGYTGVSTGGAARYSCGLNGGDPSISYSCQENQCHLLSLSSAVEGVAYDGGEACTSTHLTSTMTPFCGLSCASGYYDVATYNTKMQCLPSGGSAIPTLIASSVSNNCGGTSAHATDGVALTAWSPSGCGQNSNDWQIMIDLGESFALSTVFLDTLYDGLRGVTEYKIASCSGSDVSSASCSDIATCSATTTSSSCALNGATTRYVRLQITGTEQGHYPQVHGVEFSSNFGCVEWENCYSGTYVSREPTRQYNRECSDCADGYVSSGVNPSTCTDEAGCDGQDCGDHGSCVDNSPPYTGFTCDCDTGYHEQGGVCIDINSCDAHTCNNGGDSTATCLDRTAPDVGFDCSCSTGYEEIGGICVDINGCLNEPCNDNGDSASTCSDVSAPGVGNTCVCSSSGAYVAEQSEDGATRCVNANGCATRTVGLSTIEPCTQYGDTSSTCFDRPAPEYGNGCVCSQGYHNLVNADLTEECFPDACDGNPLIDNVDLNGPCDGTASGTVCTYRCATGYKRSGAPTLCTLGEWQIGEDNACEDALHVDRPLQDLVVDEDDSVPNVNITGLFVVDDDANTAVVTEYVANVDPISGLLQIAITDDADGHKWLSVQLEADANGVATVTIRGEVGTNTEDVSFTVTVNAVDDGPRVDVIPADIELNEDSVTYAQSLTDMFTDVDDDDANIALAVVPSSSWSSLLSLSIADNMLYVTPLEHQHGNAIVAIEATSNGKTASANLNVVVHSVNDAIGVNSTVPHVYLNEDDSETILDLNNVFHDVDGDVSEIVVASVTNSGPESLIDASVSRDSTSGDWTLRLSQGADASGSSVVVLNATSSDGTFVELDVEITVAPVDDDPYLNHPIEDQYVDEDSGDHVVDLQHTFADIDSAITLEVVGNSAPNLLTTSLSDFDLTFSTVAHQHGEVILTIRAHADGKSVDESFRVVIANTEDGPEVASGFQDMQMYEDAEAQTQNLAGAYTDADGDLIRYRLAHCEVAQRGATCCPRNATTGEPQCDSNVVAVAFADVSSEEQCRISCASTVESAIGCCEWSQNVCSWIVTDAPTTIASNVSSDVAARCSNPTVDPTVASFAEWAEMASVEIIGDTTLRVTPLAHEHGNAKVEIIVSSPRSPSLIGEMNVTILSVNDVVVIDRTLASVAVYEDADDLSLGTMSTVFVDVDDHLRSVEADVQCDPSNLFTATIGAAPSYDLLLSFAPDQHGTGVVTLHAVSEDDSNITLTVDVTVIAVDDAPVVAHSVPDQSMAEDGSALTVDVSDVFSDVDGVVAVEIVVNSRSDIVTASMNAASTMLTLTPVADMNGQTQVTLRGVSDGQSATDVFLVEVTPVDDAPVVASAVLNQTLQENGLSVTLDVSGVFTDIDGDVTVEIEGNSNDALISATIQDALLTLKPVENGGYGSAEITLRGVSDGQSATDVFKVTVQEESSNALDVMGLGDDSPYVLGAVVLAVAVAVVVVVTMYYRRRVKKREAAMDRVVKRAEAELVSVASRQWLEDELRMTGSVEDIALDSVGSMHDMADRQQALEGRIEALRKDNVRMKQNVEHLEKELKNQDMMNQQMDSGSSHEEGFAPGTTSGADVFRPGMRRRTSTALSAAERGTDYGELTDL